MMHPQHIPKQPPQHVLEHFLRQYRIDVEGGKIFSQGVEIGSVHPNGYYSIGYWTNKKVMHTRRTHLIWWAATGEWPPQMTDHIDRDPTNDTISNLRLSSARDNRNNQGRSLPRGVCLHGGTATAKPYKAQIRAEGKVKYLGIYASVEEASEAYENALKEI